MPQLDKVTFLSQFFWLCIVFSSLYLLLVKIFLPSIARLLKGRKFVIESELERVTVVRQNDLQNPETVSLFVTHYNKTMTNFSKALLENFLRDSKSISKVSEFMKIRHKRETIRSKKALGKLLIIAFLDEFKQLYMGSPKTVGELTEFHSSMPFISKGLIKESDSKEKPVKAEDKPVEAKKKPANPVKAEEKSDEPKSKSRSRRRSVDTTKKR